MLRILLQNLFRHPGSYNQRLLKKSVFRLHLPSWDYRLTLPRHWFVNPQDMRGHTNTQPGDHKYSQCVTRGDTADPPGFEYAQL